MASLSIVDRIRILIFVIARVKHIQSRRCRYSAAPTWIEMQYPCCIDCITGPISWIRFDTFGLTLDSPCSSRLFCTPMSHGETPAEFHCSLGIEWLALACPNKANIDETRQYLSLTIRRSSSLPASSGLARTRLRWTSSRPTDEILSEQKWSLYYSFFLMECTLANQGIERYGDLAAIHTNLASATSATRSSKRWSSINSTWHPGQSYSASYRSVSFRLGWTSSWLALGLDRLWPIWITNTRSSNQWTIYIHVQF